MCKVKGTALVSIRRKEGTGDFRRTEKNKQMGSSMAQIMRREGKGAVYILCRPLQDFIMKAM